MPDEYTGLHTLAGFSDLQRAATLSTKARIKTESVVKTVQLRARIEIEVVDTLGGIIEVQREGFIALRGRIKQLGIADEITSKARIETTISPTIQVEGRIVQTGVSALTTEARIKQLGVIKEETSKGRIKQLDISNSVQIGAEIAIEKLSTLAGKMFLEATRRSTLAGKTMLETAAIKRTLACKITLEEIVPPPVGFDNTLAGLITLSIWDINSAKRIAAILKFAQSVARAASYVDKGGNHITQVRQILGQYTGTTPWDAAGIAKLIVDVVKNDVGE